MVLTNNVPQEFPLLNYFACAVDSKSRVYLMGGYNGAYSQVSANTYVSTNFGVTWSQVPTYSQKGYVARASGGAGQMVSPYYGTDLIYLVGGNVCPYNGGVGGAGQCNNGQFSVNDVYVTRDYAMSWMQLTDSGGWIPRADIQLAISSAGVLVFGGGQINLFQNYNDVWTSLDGGYTWTMLQQYPFFTPRHGISTVFDENDYLYFMAGSREQAYGQVNEVYISTKSFSNIATWGPQVVPGLVVPGSSTAACLGLTCFPNDFPTCVCTQTNTLLAQQTFTMTSVLGNYQAPFSPRVNFGAFVLKNAFTYNALANGSTTLTTVVAPAGTYVIVGGGYDAWIATGAGTQWYAISGVAGLPYSTGNVPAQQGGQAACKDPNTDQMYLIGGTNSDLSTVFTSINGGATWFQVNSASSFLGRAYFGCVVDSKSIIYVIAGDTTAEAAGGSSDTWYSTNLGVTWAQQVTTQAWPTNGGRQSSATLTFYSTYYNKDLIYLIGGVDSSGNYNDGQLLVLLSSFLDSVSGPSFCCYSRLVPLS